MPNQPILLPRVGESFTSACKALRNMDFFRSRFWPPKSDPSDWVCTPTPAGGVGRGPLDEAAPSNPVPTVKRTPETKSF